MRVYKEVFNRTVWRDYDKVRDDVFVPRCGKCGKYRSDLKVHWFFRGPYCVGCIQDILYDNARNIGEINA